MTRAQYDAIMSAGIGSGTGQADPDVFAWRCTKTGKQFLAGATVKSADENSADLEIPQDPALIGRGTPPASPETLPGYGQLPMTLVPSKLSACQPVKRVNLKWAAHPFEGKWPA